MANVYRNVKDAIDVAGFRFVPDIETLSDEELEKHGYYRGFVCPHNHVIRDSKNHWCYFCVKKILSNVCGFDINYMSLEYKAKYVKLWNQIEIGDWDECWNIANKGRYSPKRVCFPSYRSAYSHQKSENVTAHKAIYQCAWGDIGSMVVTKLCGNPLCCNPLHLISSWNRLYPPQEIHPFETKFVAEKLMVYGYNQNNLQLTEKSFKNTIAHPLQHKESPE
ncbi:MAG: hypothetical protein ACO30S_07935 [Flavobacteriaceae bacterium]